jgi:uncharacterized protein YukE
MNTGMQVLQQVTRWNIVSMRTSLNTLSTERNNLQAQRNQMLHTQNRVGVNWQSPAGQQYQSRLNTDIRILENIIAQLDRRIDSLRQVISEYETCESRVQNLLRKLPR